MELNERQKQILELTEEKSRVTTGYLAQKFYVAEMTIRRDLKMMEHQGLIKRYHGGALACNNYIDASFKIRLHMNEKEKRHIAAEASKYICDGQTIFFSSSSTCLYILPYLKNYKNITVVTNSVEFLLLLSKLHIRCTLAGGEYDEREQCLLGRDTEDFLRTINTDVAFLACSGISDDGLVTETDAPIAAITKIAFRNASKKILLADKSKLGAKYTYTICSTDEVDHTIIV